jgi:hypothetical protein
VVAEQAYSVEAVTRQIIDQIRRDIDAAFLQIEAARKILKLSRWLLERWEARRRADAETGGLRLPAYDEAHAHGFVPVEEDEEPRGRRRRRRPARFPLRTGAASDRRSRRQSVSG